MCNLLCLSHLVIIRVLQAVGEYLKNTLECPKLSAITCEHLILSLPKGTRKIVIDLRNSLSHSHSLSKRMEIEKNVTEAFTLNAQNDLKKIGDVVTDILHKKKEKIITQFLQKVIDSKNLHEIKEAMEAVKSVEVTDNTLICLENFETRESKRLGSLLEELINELDDKTIYQEQLFEQIHKIIDSERRHHMVAAADYYSEFDFFKRLRQIIDVPDGGNRMNFVSQVKFFANRALENLTAKRTQLKLKDIAQPILQILSSLDSRTQSDEMKRLIYEIFHIADFEANDIRWIREFREKLSESSLDHGKGQKNYDHLLEPKISELKRILEERGIHDE